jgi:signal transduction histidine kinase
VSIDNSRLFMSVAQKNIQLLETKEQLEHRVRDLKLLFNLEQAMGRATSLEELFIAVLGEAMRACEARMGAVALRDPEDRSGSLYVIDDRADKVRRLPYPDDVGLIGWTIRSDQVLVSTDAENDPRRDADLDRRVGAGRARNALIVPLEGEQGAPMGAIAIYNKRGAKPFNDEDRALLALIAANASTAIRLQLTRDSREREERLTTIGRLLSSVIHDMKTPLTVIRGYVQMMKSTDDGKQRADLATIILKQFEHIGAMQREVLAFARGEKRLLLRRVYVQKFFEEVREQLESELAKRGVELVVDVQERGTARFDEGKMLRVVHNLARNAAEAMGRSGGKLVIKVTRDKSDRALVVSFSDTGPGIPKEIEHQLFQSFVTRGKAGGTGLGLAIVKKIADEHGGTISVQSSSRGATFKLRIPQPAAREPHP